MNKVLFEFRGIQQEMSVLERDPGTFVVNSVYEYKPCYAHDATKPQKFPVPNFGEFMYDFKPRCKLTAANEVFDTAEFTFEHPFVRPAMCDVPVFTSEQVTYMIGILDDKNRQKIIAGEWAMGGRKR